MCLAVKVDGTKMTPYAVVSAKKAKNELKSLSGVIVAATPNGWMNDDLTMDWVQGCKLELEELGNFGRTRKIKISELKLELELEKSLWSLSSFNE